ncbi:hypothetical protein [Demequina flava]|uniref:hypothetical protein n=1 Tax=Demequina flava TaxID=1095025 RepID=UPI00128B0E95|nr:hypothetical protein [Demequina flava]
MNNSLTARQRVVRPVGVVLVGLEAVALLVFAVVTVVDSISGDGTGLGFAVAGTLVIFAVALGLAARALARGQRWGRSYSIMWQLLQIASAALMFSSAAAVAVAAIVVGVIAGGAVMLDAIEEMPDDE